MNSFVFRSGGSTAIKFLLHRTLVHPVMLFSIIFFFLLGCNETPASKKEDSPSSQTVSTKPYIIEIVSAPDAAKLLKLKDIIKEYKIAGQHLYRWKNHFVIYDSINDKTALRKELETEFGKSSIRLYDSAFYQFDRSHCATGTPAKKWKAYLLTANLVKDTTLQKEYLAYHATQFKKWPEVAQGFCNASFQQLLVFKNGRQLMLVISVPEGKTLDELNPKTTENNPRVTAWNNLMKKYQEGIEGTTPGKTWVFLEPVAP
jgi:hypothetical protein